MQPEQFSSSQFFENWDQAAERATQICISARFPANQLLLDTSSLETLQKPDATECVGSMSPVGMIYLAGVSFW
jgi:hypothetical protein